MKSRLVSRPAMLTCRGLPLLATVVGFVAGDRVPLTSRGPHVRLRIPLKSHRSLSSSREAAGRLRSETRLPGSHTGHLATSVALELRGGGVASDGAAALVPDATVGLKLGLGVVLLTTNVLCWLAPLKVKSFTENAVALSLANSFSGGVFLALAFGHLLPHALHGFEEALGQPAVLQPLLAALGGYMLIFFVEQVLFGESHDLGHGDDGGT